ncbi:S8 family serine peptidase [Streptomyces sp. NPDC020917]|uniref:S8 family serine peptidase n=1 Tax=Streptomyces sp. NPDC020917 TaxID=3365102 RepID=UPI003796A8AC
MATRSRRGRTRRSTRTLVAGVVTALAAVCLPAVTASAVPAAAPTARPQVEPKVESQLAAHRTTTFWVYLRSTAKLSDAARITDRDRQGEVVESRLKATAHDSQAGLVGLLDAAHAAYRSYWIANTVEVTGDAGLLRQIEALPEVGRITADRTYALPKDRKAAAVPSDAGVEWGVDAIGASKVWSEDHAAGAGMVVGSIDSGVEYTHPALVHQYRGNNGDGTFDDNYNWWDPARVCGVIETYPCDNIGHGTHTMGIMVGDDGTNHIGVAPKAKWIAAKGCEVSSCSQGSLLSSGQFMLAPTDLDGRNPRPDLRPDVVNNSWGSGDADTDPWFQQTVQAWVAAGIFPVFSNGNDGPVCNTDANPANLVDSYGVGAFDSDGNIASFSSRGPSDFDNGLIKPDVSAPGVAIRSAWPGSTYAVASGTSMAAPSVAGAIALLWSAAPALEHDIGETRLLLDKTATHVKDLSCGGTAELNNVWGNGKLDVYAAVQAAPRGAAGVLTGTVRDADTGAPIAGASVQLSNASGQVGVPHLTGADGTYRIPASAGGYTVSAGGLGYRTGSGPATVTQDGTSGLDLALDAPRGPGLAATPSELDFPTTAVGTRSDPITVTLTSTGNAPVTVRRLPDHDGSFVHAGGTCPDTPFQLPRLQTCTVQFAFLPTAKGSSTGSADVTSTSIHDSAHLTLTGTGTSRPARAASIQTHSLEDNLDNAVIDPSGRYAYYATYNTAQLSYGYIVKVDLRTFKRVGVITVNYGLKLITRGVMDPAGQYAYFAVASTPSLVLRIDLATFKVTGSLKLANGENNVRSAIMDPAGRYAYFGTASDPYASKVVKVDLATFTEVGKATLDPADQYLSTAVVSPDGRYGYFGTLDAPGRILKVDLESMAKVGELTMAPGESYLRTSVVDPEGRYAYFGTGEGTAGNVVRIDLSTFQRTGAVPVGGGGVFSSVMDPHGQFAAFGTQSIAGHVAMIDLTTFTRLDTATMNLGENALDSAVIDPNGDYAYFGTHTTPGRVVKVRVGVRYTLRAAPTTVRDAPAAELAWAGASTPDVDVVRDGTVIATVPNTGGHLDRIPGAGGSPYSYQVCDAGSDRCSNTVTVSLTP